MKNLIPQAGWLVGGALLLASGIHCRKKFIIPSVLCSQSIGG